MCVCRGDGRRVGGKYLQLIFLEGIQTQTGHESTFVSQVKWELGRVKKGMRALVVNSGRWCSGSEVTEVTMQHARGSRMQSVALGWCEKTVGAGVTRINTGSTARR